MPTGRLPTKSFEPKFKYLQRGRREERERGRDGERERGREGERERGREGEREERERGKKKYLQRYATQCDHADDSGASGTTLAPTYCKALRAVIPVGMVPVRVD